MRNSKLQQKAINYGIRKTQPVIQKVGSELISQLSTAVRPDEKYKTDRPDLDGSDLDIHAAIGKLPVPKKSWTLPGHHYTGPYHPLEQQLKYAPESRKILEVYQRPAGRSDAVAMKHDVDYASCEYRANNYGEKKMLAPGGQKLVK